MSQMPDEEKLALYVQRCQELVDCRIWREGGLSLQVLLKPEGVQVREPDKDNVRSFLTIFRQIIAPREPVFIKSVNEIAKQHLTPEHAVEAARFDSYLAKWDLALQKSAVNIAVDGEQLSPQHVLEVYIDGEYFHNDVRDRTELARFAKFAVRVDKIRFVQTLADLTEIILEAGNTIGYGINHNWFNFTENK